MYNNYQYIIINILYFFFFNFLKTPYVFLSAGPKEAPSAMCGALCRRLYECGLAVSLCVCVCVCEGVL